MTSSVSRLSSLPPLFLQTVACRVSFVTLPSLVNSFQRKKVQKVASSLSAPSVDLFPLHCSRTAARLNLLDDSLTTRCTLTSLNRRAGFPSIHSPRTRAASLFPSLISPAAKQDGCDVAGNSSSCRRSSHLVQPERQVHRTRAGHLVLCGDWDVVHHHQEGVLESLSDEEDCTDRLDARRA